MLDSIYKLAKAHDINANDDKLSSLLTSTMAKHVIGIVFQNKKGIINYQKSQLYEFDKPHWYLYKKDPSGKLGLFLTSAISRIDIEDTQQLAKNLTLNHDKIEEFCKKKILWFPKSKLVKNKDLLMTLSPERRDELSKILQNFEKEQGKILHDVLEILMKDTPEITLVTIMIQNSKDSNPLFIGQVKEYMEFFVRGTLAKKPNSIGVATCNVCNIEKSLGIFRERPLPFFFADKPMFFPNANKLDARKGFPLCDDCYLELQRGTKFIENKLKYALPLLGSKKSTLNFWLIPHLNDQELMIHFKDDLSNSNLYLNYLKELCQTLKTLEKYDHHESARVEAFLRFSALFYKIDHRGLMRVTNYIQGIYPSQLQKLLDVKQSIDETYPYEIMSRIYKKEEFLVGFPLITEFYIANRKQKTKQRGQKTESNKTAQLENQVVSLLENMFTGQRIDIGDVIEKVMIRIRETAKFYDLKSFTRIVFLGLLLLEYLINVNDLQKERSKSMSEQDNLTTRDVEHVEHVQKFILNHSNILGGGVERAAFAVGVCVGILLEIQSELYNKTAPFWNRLNRLDLDPETMFSLFTEVKSKLAMYKEEHFNTIINYLAVNEISRKENVSKINNDNLNLIFSIGLSYGYMLKRRLLN